MKKTFTFLILFLILTTELIWGTQQIETVVFPSEDEIAEAFYLGEISFEQFQILTELIANQVEPSSFLLDEIPNTLLQLDTVKTGTNKFYQVRYFIDNSDANFSQVTIKNQYASYLDENARSRYQTSVNYNREKFNLNFILRKEYSGRERIIRRYISFTPVGSKDNIIIGNFSKRFGLGGIIGYRGKILSYSDNFDSESFLFPDYGGFNGVYVKKHIGGNLLESIISYQRDSSFSVFTKSFMFRHESKYFPFFIFAQHELTERNSSKSFQDIKTSLYKNFKYTNGYFKTEFVAEFNKQNNSSAILLDGRHRTKRIYLTYALWNYGEAFLNISGGSKTSLISEYVFINEIQSKVLSKRSNQTGGMLKTEIKINPKWKIDIASIYAYKNSDTTETQIFSQVTRKILSSAKLSVDILFRNKERNDITNYIPQKKIQTRLMLVNQTDKFYLRNYISTLKKTDEPLYVGFFSEIRIRPQNYGLIHFWFNFSRFNTDSNRLDYFYGFIKNEIPVHNSFYISFKLSHRYSRSATDKHQNQFSINVSWQI